VCVDVNAEAGRRASPVRIWEADLVVPTYRAGRPLPYPLFLEHRVYQGSAGRVYPYPVIDHVADEPVDEAHRVVWLENEYLRVMVMPAFGGRIQCAYDKTNGYPFIYHNRVIKPALVGLAGPWLSGGIEFNWPQHHRPGTFCPVDHRIVENGDGSATLWLGETEPMWHLRGVLALTLHPGRAVLTIAVHLANPTPLPRSFHLWTNPAVHVNDDYQSVFPPDVQAVYDHGKRDVSAFPIARGRYYKVDYTSGVDISWYKNLPVPTSYMAAGSKYDFLGGYDHGRGAGMLHVADHHVVPGKKQWVWGCGEFGKAWDRQLTDADGPYAELMCGVFADNQPDFAWLAPFEQKTVTQSFLPYKAIGYVRNATVDAAVSLDVEGTRARIGAYTTSIRKGALVSLTSRGRAVWREQVDLGPEAPLVRTVRLPRRAPPRDLRLEVTAADGSPLVAYAPEPVQPPALPDPARAIPAPKDVTTSDALYLAGLHIEQYRHATRNPDDYYREALGRDPDDLRANLALGRRLYERGGFDEAEPLLCAAVATATRHNANPRDGEAHYLLALVRRARGHADDAQRLFAKAAWDPRWEDAACLALAEMAAARGDSTAALARLEQALARNARHAVARHVRALVLRRAGRAGDAASVVEALLASDPLDPGALYERARLAAGGDTARHATAEWLTLTRAEASVHLDLAARYAACGALDDAIDLLERVAAVPDPLDARAPGHDGPAGLPNLRPLLHYAAAHYAALAGRAAVATAPPAPVGQGFSPVRQRLLRVAHRHRARAAASNRAACFPNSLEHQAVLESALAANPADATAAYLLGLLWYDRREVERARDAWVRARRLEPADAPTHRNLAILAFNKQHARGEALRSMRRARALAPGDARLLFELDLLEKRCGVDPARRLRRLEAHRALVASRDDLSIELVTLLNTVGRHDRALTLLLSRRFHPWEGGEGRAAGQHRVALGRVARLALGHGDAEEAVRLFERSREYPASLGEGRLHGTLENETLYWLGVAHAQAGRASAARACWRDAARGMERPAPALYYNDQDPATIAYQGLALAALGRPAAARERFTTLVRFGTEHLRDRVEIDFFAVSLPEFQVFDDDLQRRHETNCRFLRALGWWGLGSTARARGELRRVLGLDPAHQAARLTLRWGP
jgi:tetratricopeptide (TPR) repeat protein